MDTLILEVQKLLDFDEEMCKLNSSIYRIEEKRKARKKFGSSFDWLKHITSESYENEDSVFLKT